MPAVLTHKTIMLLARERLIAIRDALNTKLNTAGAAKSDLEHRVMFLADQAVKMMTDTTLGKRGVLFPSGADYPTPLGKDVSPFSVMGSMGPDITAFSSMFARGQGWVFDNIHKGSPDANREPVVAKTTDFTLELWNQVSQHVAAKRASDKDAKKMQAYVLGHLCHIAADVLSHPYINDIEWHLGNRTRGKFSHAGGEGSIDARVATQLLLRQSTREGQEWDKWWPTADEVPEVFWASYIEALDVMYQVRSADNRVKGFGEFEAKFLERKSPAASLDFVKDGYHVYRNGILSIGYGYGYGSWFGVLTPIIIPMSALIGLAGALPHSREFFTKAFNEVSERGWWELFTLPLAVGSIVPVIFGIWVATLSSRDVVGLTAAGLTLSIVNLILAVVFFSTVGMSDADLPWWARWFFIFAPLFVTPLVFGSIAVHNIRSVDNGAMYGGLAAIYAVPIAFWILTIALVLGIVILTGGLIELLVGAIWGFESTAVDVIGVAFWVLAMLLLTAVMIVAWIMLPTKLRDAKIPEHTKPFPVDHPHFVRLFDDSTLFHDPSLATPTARQLFYPSERRPLLKLWFTGGGDLYVRSEQRWLSFSDTGTGLPTQRVQAPITPMTVADLGLYLEAAVNNLHAKPVFPTDLAPGTDANKEGLLPTGALFSEDSDEDAEERGLPASAFAWKKLEKTEADAKYILRHADKPYQAVRFGQRGLVEQGQPQDEYTPGPGKVTAAGTTVTGTDTLFLMFFDPGDQIAVGTQVRPVTLVASDTSMEIGSPFSPAISSASDYVRLGPTDLMAPCPGQVTCKAKTVTGVGTSFRQFIAAGDLILVGTQARQVVEVKSDTELEVDSKFKPDIGTATDHSRVTLTRERAEGYTYVARAATAQAVGGGSVMDFAADFAALLCLGMTPHLLDSTKRTVPTLKDKKPKTGPGAIDQSVGKVYQVFRNWSLDRRRLNEWRMIVAGGARTEKTTANEYDAAMAQPQPPVGDWKPGDVVQAGEPISRTQGWVPVLRQWMTRMVAGNATTATPGPNGTPSNLELSQAMAFLLDLKPPRELAP